ncbi:MAG: serine/threonine protein kinase [Gemmatimonadaceae bacterium]|nr:serine/threonine protein kinase [Gemmatimonadaceae bacterium]
MSDASNPHGAESASATTGAARLRRIRELFDAAVDRDVSEHADLLAQLAPGDAALHAEVMDLLHADSATDVRLASPLDSALARSLSASMSAADDMVGARLGAYELVRLVGRGGMGTVYEAVRVDDQYRKRVAVKLVQQGLDSALALTRFRRERQILANLEHRNIATLLDGGVTADGRPFLVMEFVQGAPLTSWCDQRQATIRERVSLFRQVCAAVQHAHKNLVVHRDIKPGNILVTDDGTVKLLDFGIATLLTVDEDPDMPITRGAARAFTPEYASPEQLRGDVLSTASDVYSLGVVLFELLTGRRPHLVSSRALIDLERAVLETPSPRPSSVIADEVVFARGERSADRLRRRLQGDLDAIALRALAPEVTRRYASVEAIADDLRRFLDNLPVRAQHDWAGYRLGKFLRRNVAAVAASALVVLALIGGVATTTAQARRARLAQLQAEQVSGFLRAILSSVKPATGGRDVPVSEILDSAATRLKVDLADQPLARVDLERVIAASYQSLGRYDDADRHLREALALRRARGRDGVVAILNDLGGVFLSRRDLPGADSVFRIALSLHDSISSAPDTIRALIYDNMGTVAHDRGDLQAAARLHGIALAELQRLLGPTDDRVAIALNNVAVARGDLNDFVVAESLHREVVGIVRRNHPEPNTLVADAENQLAGVLDMQGKTAAAESVFVRVLAQRKSLLGDQHPDYAYTLFSYAMNQMDLKKYQSAISACGQVLAFRGKTIPEAHPSVASCLQTMGRARDQLGDTTGGREALEESLALRRKHLPAGSWLVASSESVLGEHFTNVKDFATAERHLLPAAAVLAEQMSDASPRTQLALARLVALYDAWGKPDRAAQFRKRLTPPRQGAP